MSMCAPPLAVCDEDRRELERLSRSVSEPVRVVRQARVLLLAADGLSNEETARRGGVAPNTVRAWRRGFAQGGLRWLGTTAPGRGPERSLTAAAEAAIVADTLTVEPPDGAVCWSTRQMAARHGVGKDIVARVWRERGLRPWLADVFKVSLDPDFEAKLQDVIGLYVDPPERAVVFSFDEKTQIQALDRTQPSLPMRPGRNRTLTHDYKRNGTIDLFAALNVATGEVLHQTRKRHTGADVLAFFKWIDLHTPAHLDVHIVLDNLSAHKSEPVRKWLHPPRTQAQPLTQMAPPPPPQALAPPLHPHQLKLGQPRRRLVLDPHPQNPQNPGLQLRRRTPRHHRTLDRAPEPRPPTPQMAQTRGGDHHKNPPSPNRTQPRNQTRDTPLGGWCFSSHIVNLAK